MGAELTTCLFLSATATATAAGEDTKQTPPDMIRIRFEDAIGCNAAIESAGVADLRDWAESLALPCNNPSLARDLSESRLTAAGCPIGCVVMS